MDRNAPGMVIGVSLGGERTVGAAGGVRPDGDAVFRIASLTKPLTAAATVLALAERSIPLATPAVELLPALAGDWRADRGITVEQLLGQVSGLREAVDGSAVGMLGDGPEVLERAARLVVRGGNDRAPGERWSYYNGNYFLAGCVLASVVGAGYEEALDRVLLQPWGLKATGFDTPEAPVTGWDGSEPLPVEAYPRGRRPSGGLWSTAADYLSFAERLLADPVLLDETRRPRTRPDDPTRYGLGWALGPSGQMYLNGRLSGYRTAVLLVPEQRFAAVALGNQSQLLPEIAQRLNALQFDLTGDDLSAAIDAFAA